jgi:hypothetical protein
LDERETPELTAACESRNVAYLVDVCILKEACAMRMPILSYFIVAGTALVGLLFWVSNELDPNSSPIKTSQTVGVAEPFKAQPEQPQYKIEGVNFAAEQDQSVTRPVQTAEPTAKQKITSKPSTVPMWNRLAESPHDNLSVH